MPKVRYREPRNLSLKDDSAARPARRAMRRKILFGESAIADREKAELEIRARRAYESAQIQDPFKAAYTSSLSATGPEHILPPPYNPYTLMRFPNENNTLRQCIDAMVINIESMGHRLEYVGPDGGDESKEALAEKAKLEALLDQPNGEYSLIELRERCRRDKETFGYRCIEICRGLYNNEIVSYYHVPAHTIRLTTVDLQETEVDIWLLRDAKYVKQKIKKRFRRYVQEIGNKKVYFKEYGDPRRISSKNGRPDDNTPDNELATELHIEHLYNPGSPYGVPRWINQLPAIMGSRESELTNLQFFKDNAIPAMAVLVSGGHLTADSIDDIEELMYSVQGRDAVHRVLVLEAEGADKAVGPDKTIPSPKLEMKPLIHDRQSDALFQDYDKNNQAKVRSSFRLPPIFIGRSEDLTHATASASLVMAEGQVFGPERNKVDDFFNFVILTDKNGRPPAFWWFRSNPPRIVDPSAMIDALTTFDGLGALTPNISIGIANELFDLNIPLVQDEWGDYPFEIVMALVGRGQLKGLEGIKDEIEPIDDSLNPGSGKAKTKLTPEQELAVQEKVVQPLKNLVSAGNVRKVQKRSGASPKRRG